MSRDYSVPILCQTLHREDGTGAEKIIAPKERTGEACSIWLPQVQHPLRQRGRPAIEDSSVQECVGQCRSGVVMRQRLLKSQSSCHLAGILRSHYVQCSAQITFQAVDSIDRQ